jgi:hypothetical protein
MTRAECQKRYRESEKGRALRAAWTEKNRARLSALHWHNKPRDKTTNVPYPKPDPEVARNARVALGNAVRDGKVVKIPYCQWCGSAKKVDGHHASYAEDMWLCVTWLCRGCHIKLHKGFWK